MTPDVNALPLRRDVGSTDVLPACLVRLTDRTALAIVLIAGCAPVSVAAQARDEQMVLVRGVQPRIAYRAVPLEDNPMRVRATVFPGVTFHRAMDGLDAATPDASAFAAIGATLDTADGAVLDGQALDEHASAGLRGMAVPGLATGPAAPLMPMSTALAPLGASASSTTGAGAALRGLGGRVSGALGALPGGGR